MPEQTTGPTTEVDPKWVLIMDRLRVDDLAAWLRTFRTGSRASNPDWRSWESIARRIWEETRVTVTASGLRARWSDEVDALVAPGGPTPASNAVGPAGTGASEPTP